MKIFIVKCALTMLDFYAHSFIITLEIT